MAEVNITGVNITGVNIAERRSNIQCCAGDRLLNLSAKNQTLIISLLFSLVI
ncbi:MAG TPA: hypothetical protein V6C57_16200 [Coleofasciculaceae cyanobacterium]